MCRADRMRRAERLRVQAAAARDESSREALQLGKQLCEAKKRLQQNRAPVFLAQQLGKGFSEWCMSLAYRGWCDFVYKEHLQRNADALHYLSKAHGEAQETQFALARQVSVFEHQQSRHSGIMREVQMTLCWFLWRELLLEAQVHHCSRSCQEMDETTTAAMSELEAAKLLNCNMLRRRKPMTLAQGFYDSLSSYALHVVWRWWRERVALSKFCLLRDAYSELSVQSGTARSRSDGEKGRRVKILARWMDSSSSGLCKALARQCLNAWRSYLVQLQVERVFAAYHKTMTLANEQAELRKRRKQRDTPELLMRSVALRLTEIYLEQCWCMWRRTLLDQKITQASQAYEEAELARKAYAIRENVLQQEYHRHSQIILRRSGAPFLLVSRLHEAVLCGFQAICWSAWRAISMERQLQQVASQVQDIQIQYQHALQQAQSSSQSSNASPQNLDEALVDLVTRLHAHSDECLLTLVRQSCLWASNGIAPRPAQQLVGMCFRILQHAVGDAAEERLTGSRIMAGAASNAERMQTLHHLAGHQVPWITCYLRVLLTAWRLLTNQHPHFASANVAGRRSLKVSLQTCLAAWSRQVVLLGRWRLSIVARRFADELSRFTSWLSAQAFIAWKRHSRRSSTLSRWCCASADGLLHSKFTRSAWRLLWVWRLSCSEAQREEIVSQHKSLRAHCEKVRRTAEAVQRFNQRVVLFAILEVWVSLLPPNREIKVNPPSDLPCHIVSFSLKPVVGPRASEMHASS